MANQTVVGLQNTLNRFSSVAGFKRIGIDGVMGPDTGNAVLKSLAYAANADEQYTDTASGLAYNLTSADGSINYAQIEASASGLTTYLGQVADGLSLAASQNVAASGGGGGSILNPTPGMPGSGAATNILTSFKALPVWAKVAGGIALTLVGLAAVEHAHNKHGSLKGFLGLSSPSRQRRHA